MARKSDLFHELLDELIDSKDELFVPEVKAPRSASDDLTRLFLEIVAFRERTGHEPSQNTRLPEEMRLGVRLATYRNDPENVVKLRDFDQYNLLQTPNLKPSDEIPASLDELLASGDDLLSTPDDHIFEFRATPAPQAKSEPDVIAERVRCPDFEKYQPIFDECIADVANGARSTVPTSSTYQIATGDIFILDGQLAYIADVGAWQTRGDMKDARLRIIYDNGTESDHLLRSFGKALYRSDNSRRVLAGLDGLFDLRVTGCIYVARTLSKDPNLSDLRDHIVKIGSTNGSAKDRIVGAVSDPTFLLAEAKIMDEYETKGIAPSKIEALLHRFFAAACVNLQIPDRFGRNVDPREWFFVSPGSVEKAVRLIGTRSLHLYRYDVAEDGLKLK